jgi:hypothetical protein
LCTQTLFLVGLGFELRASWLQSKLSTVWAIPPVYFALVILEMGVLQTVCLDWLALNHDAPNLSLPNN